ncbi:MAG: IS3 family transposase [Oscillospiraceae bacterium]|nr:IS3 family transposase [Oscillospiraceae bacterium]
MTSRDDNRLNIVWLCEIVGISRSGYYSWLKAESSRQARENQDHADFELIIAAYKFRGYDKGGRGIHMWLLHLAPPVVMNTKKVYRLMRKYNFHCPIRKPNPYRKMRKAIDESYVAKNLLNREFKLHGSRMVLLTDITYMKRMGGAFSYMSAIKDAFTTEILAHVVSESLEEDFVLQTVQLLIANHGHELKTDVLMHSDQGVHYKAIEFVKLLKDSKLRQSMSRKANCWDNAPQESLWGHMKDEIDIDDCETNADVARVVDDWVDYYNNDRYQWDLAKLSPSEYYKYISTGVYPLARK